MWLILVLSIIYEKNLNSWNWLQNIIDACIEKSTSNPSINLKINKQIKR